MQVRIGNISGLWIASILVVLPTVWGCTGAAPGELSEGTQLVGRGMELRRFRIASSPSTPTITAIYFDPDRFELELQTSQRHGDPRTARRWCDDRDLVAAINASMYLRNLRSTGWMIDDGSVNNGAINPAYGGVLAFGPRRSGIPPLRFYSTSCDDSVSTVAPRDYRSVIQNYRLLDCEAEAIEWRDPKTYSSAAVGMDARGWIVFVHSGEPCRTSDFSRWLTDERWDLVAAHFVEGGPDASLYARWEHGSIELSGRYGGVGSTRARPIPNVLGIRARRAP